MVFVRVWLDLRRHFCDQCTDNRILNLSLACIGLTHPVISFVSAACKLNPQSTAACCADWCNRTETFPSQGQIWIVSAHSVSLVYFRWCTVVHGSQIWSTSVLLLGLWRCFFFVLKFPFVLFLLFSIFVVFKRDNQAAVTDETPAM